MPDGSNSKTSTRSFATSGLGVDEPGFAPLAGVASGLIAVRISGEPGELLLWFRSERVRTVTWGGNPFKPPSDGDDPTELSPRRSFAQWHQVVEGTSDPWTTADLTTARLIGASVTDVIVQFRSVRILMAQDELDQVLRRVQLVRSARHRRGCGWPDIGGQSRFVALLGDRDPPQYLKGLAEHFADADAFAGKLRMMRENKQSWRGEARLRGSDGESRPLLVARTPCNPRPIACSDSCCCSRI